MYVNTFFNIFSHSNIISKIAMSVLLFLFSWSHTIHIVQGQNIKAKLIKQCLCIFLL